MSLRTTDRLLITSGLALMLAAGCGDGDNPPAANTGDMDSGRDAGRDSGRDTGAEEIDLPTAQCGTTLCTGAIVQNTDIRACCLPDTNGCGLNADDLKRANSSTPFTGCIPKDVMASVENSAYCGGFWDQVEQIKKPELNMNGGLDIASGSVTLTFEGCCLPSGECGAMITTPRGQEADVVNTHLGCVSFKRLQEALASEADGGVMEQPANPPFCNPMTGEVVSGTMTAPTIPKFVCGCGAGNVYDPLDTTRTFPCINNVAVTVCGREDPTTTELAQVPEFICGCPAAPEVARLPCLANVDKAVCGTKQIDTNSAELARIPVFICGEDPTKPSALPTLKGVDPTVCGKKTPDANDLAAVPAFICGEVGNPDTSTLPKMKNVGANTCGTLAVASGSPFLAQVPEFLCGCPTTPNFTCLRNVSTTVCGAKPITADSPDLLLVPEFICGLEGLTGTPTLPVLRNVENAICGKKLITSGSTAELSQIPAFICGAENNPDTSAFPKMRNVDTTVCGTQPVTAGVTSLAGVPAVMCGCGTAGPTNEFGCMRNVATNVCGLDRSRIPVITCGCGETTALGATESLCLPYAAATTCGTLPITVDSTNNCLTNVPEYAVGCGSATSTPAAPCITGAPALRGCTAVASGTVRGIPTFVCGCGDGVLANGRPCLDNVPTTVCGARAIPLAALTHIERSVCGCGASVTYDPSNPAFVFPCLSKTATDTCGPGAINVTDPNGTPGDADDCYTRWPAYLNGCGVGVTTGSCIRNGATTTFGCIQPEAGRRVPGQSYFACGCGVGVFTSNCIPNVNTDVCGATAPTPTHTAAAPTFFCGCGSTVPSRPRAAPSLRLPCLSYTDLTTCGTGSAGVDTAVLGSLPSTLCGCGATTVTWDPSNTTTFPGPCLSKTTGVTCGGTAICNVGDPAGTLPCAGALSCADRRGGAGAGPYGVTTGPGDGLGDTCE